jgi:hypothetical protein
MKLLLMVSIFASGTQVVMTKGNYSSCNGVVQGFKEFKNIQYYTIQLDKKCDNVKLSYVTNDQFEAVK